MEISQSKTAISQAVAPRDILARATRLHTLSRIIVGVSCGKDATATLDLCAEHFPPHSIYAYFQYIVPGLSFQDSYLAYLERRYADALAAPIIRLPHWTLSHLYRAFAFRERTLSGVVCPPVRIRDVFAYLRRETGADWIATGEKCCDSLERNAQIRHCQAIDATRRKLYPIAFLSQGAVFSYLRSRNIALPPEYGTLGSGRSFGSLWYREVAPIRERYPADYAKILRYFPLLEGQIVRREAAMKKEKQQLTNSNSRT